mgnify:CR=1 FL=1
MVELFRPVRQDSWASVAPERLPQTIRDSFAPTIDGNRTIFTLCTKYADGFVDPSGLIGGRIADMF